MYDLYQNFEDYDLTKKRKALTVFGDAIANINMMANFYWKPIKIKSYSY